jgi:superfamily II DNA or RNA helicase
MDDELAHAGTNCTSEADRRKQYAIKREQAYLKLVAEFEPVADCPLVTPYTRFMGVADATMQHLYAIRRQEPDDPNGFRLPPIPGMNPDLKPRIYQELMAEHIYLMPRIIVGDGVGLGKTVEAIIALTRLRNDLAAQGICAKIIILTTTSTAYQWESEIKRFSDLRPWVLKDAYKFEGTKKQVSGHPARLAQLQKFLAHPRLNVLVCRYSQWLGVRQAQATTTKGMDGRTLIEDGKELLSREMLDFKDTVAADSRARLTLILDETHRIKTKGASGRNFVVSIQGRFNKVVAMTATPIKNRLDEFYSIASAIGISPLLSLNNFIAKACITERRWMPKAGVAKEFITGYHPEAIVKFRVSIRPWYWGRTQYQVKEPMPKLSTVLHPVDLDKATMKLLLEDIPSGAYVLPPAVKLVAGELVLTERDPSNLMTALSVQQMCANSPALLDPANPRVFFSPKLSPKEEMLLDLLDGDLEGESVIVFTKYRSFIDRLEHLTAHQKFTTRNFLRITGAENPKVREIHRLRFQNQPDEYNLITINTAGIEGINLQRAAHMICLDIPWSWGDLIQLVGRMVRMASPNAACILHILYACGTVDEYVLEVQRSKKGLFERILGTSSTCGLLDDGEINVDEALKGLEGESDDKFMDLMRAHAKAIGLRPYAFGTILAQENAGMRSKEITPGMGAKVVEDDWSDRW